MGEYQLTGNNFVEIGCLVKYGVKMPSIKNDFGSFRVKGSGTRVRVQMGGRVRYRN